MDKPRPDYVTTLTDDEWRRLDVEIRALHVARGLCKLKVREVKANRGYWVAKFLGAVGLSQGYSWCAAFVYFCLITAGADPKKLPPKRNAASVWGWYSWASANNRLEEHPDRGRSFFWLDLDHKAKQWKGHTGWDLQPLTAGRFPTIEGNTNAKGSREGDGVHEKTRGMRELAAHDKYGFINLGGLA